MHVVLISFSLFFVFFILLEHQITVTLCCKHILYLALTRALYGHRCWIQLRILYVTSASCQILYVLRLAGAIYYEPLKKKELPFSPRVHQHSKDDSKDDERTDVTVKDPTTPPHPR
jgi:hypothetical protein